MWEILIFEVISTIENSNKFHKNQVLEGKISGGCGNTWANARATLVYIKDADIYRFSDHLHSFHHGFLLFMHLFH
jgi:hypothetical protein